MIGWLGRKTLLYVLLVLAFLAAAFVVPWIRAEWTGPGVHIERADTLEAIKQQVGERQATADRALIAARDRAASLTVDQIDSALATARSDLAAQTQAQRSTAAQAASLLTVDTDAIIADRQRALTIQLREREIAGLRATRERLVQGNLVASLGASIADSARNLAQLNANAAAAQATCREVTARLEKFDEQWLVRMTLQQYRRRDRAVLLSVQRDECGKARLQRDTARAAQAAQATLQQQREGALRTYRQASGWAAGAMDSVTAGIDERIAAERTIASGSFRAKLAVWAEEMQLAKVLRQAAVALVLIIASPFLIRLLFYYVLAPIAMRRPAIRLAVPGGSGAPIPLTERSATSVAVQLQPGEELLVRQDYLQTTSHIGAKGTQWFMDWRHPITSIATGLTFLTRIRGAGETTTVSAVTDPFAEVAVVTLPPTSACVLQPRALAAIVQPQATPLRVTSHWRLFSLNAWLTLQLRYLVFHGPARLIVKGGRGVRVEQAERGRVFGQHQLVGFSADLGYSVTRTETFWPYFLSREPLLKDRVESGEGVLIVEEAPMAGRGGRYRRGGLEGMMDAGMKVFGM